MIKSDQEKILGTRRIFYARRIFYTVKNVHKNRDCCKKIQNLKFDFFASNCSTMMIYALLESLNDIF